MTANRQPDFTINASVKSIYTFLKLVVVLNILFLTGTWLSANQVLFPDIITLQWYLAELNFAKENVLAAWYSSMLFFSTGIAAALCFWADMQRREENKTQLLNYGWLVMSGIFVTLSFDEMGSFHEMISQTSMFKKAGGGNGKIIFFGLIGAVAIFMCAFFFSKLKKDKLALALTILGVLLFISNPFQEKFEIHSWRSSPDPANWRRPIGFLLMEEGSEIFASFCFLFSFVTYAINAAPGVNAVGEKILKLKTAVSKYLVFWVGAMALLLGVAMLVIHINAWEMPGDDDGLPQDWPPAAIFFGAFIMSVYLLFKQNLLQYKPLCKVIAGTALISSAYFGSYMYGYWQGPFAVVRFVFLGVTIGTVIMSFVKFKDNITRMLLTGWLAFIVLSFLRREFASAMYGYIGGACLLLALFWHYKNGAEQSR
jgi:hypothetical protein